MDHPSALSATSCHLSAQTEVENPNNLKLNDEFDLMEYLDEEFVALMGQGLETCSSSTSSLMNMGIGSSFSSSTSPVVLNFTNPNSPPPPLPPPDNGEAEEVPKIVQHENTTRAAGRVRPPSQTYDHILAERRRREQLSRHFVALSTIVPGLKKMDKTSILGEAITHLKYLQERVKILEDEARKKSIESVVLVTKSSDDHDNKRELPKIEARVCDGQIFLIIECEYRKGLLTKVIATLENLNLTILTTQATRFGILLLQITIITKMEKEFNSSVNQVLKSLHACCNQE